ncbi:unnamed protein product [Ilex paraguariensis]|uniref:Uncharacterized protein n=1 Tax=Ilex paraguariensis TaxID=185542 RepID=A0ABC8RIB7_9AQUA
MHARKGLGAQAVVTPIGRASQVRKCMGLPRGAANVQARRIGAYAVERLASQVSEATEAMIPVRRAGCAPWQSCQIGVYGEPSRKSWVLRMSRLR